MMIYLPIYFFYFRDVWPEGDCFGTYTATPEEELMLLRDIFYTNLGPGE